jgi:hypothetical protein
MRGRRAELRDESIKTDEWEVEVDGNDADITDWQWQGQRWGQRNWREEREKQKEERETRD